MKRGFNKMKILKQLLFTFAIVVGFSLTAFAQKDNQEKPPPKEKPPVVNPGEKPPREKPPENDRGNDKPKKPNAILVKTENGFAITFV
jgi:hypothetical protein